MDVSILIPLFNRLELTRACLESLERTAGRVRYEVILIDDGSTDGTPDFLRSLAAPRYRILLNEQPRGYAYNNNAAARLAQAPVLCLLNNDTVLMPGWLQPMLRVLRRSERAGFVGNVQREPFSGLIDHIGVQFNGRGVSVHAGKNDSAPPPEEYGRWAAVTAACCLIRKEVFISLGGFDEAFRNGFEDTDFCLRAADAGYRHYVANRSSIYHYISASPGRREFEEDNLQRYRERWGARTDAFLKHRAVQVRVWEREHVFSEENQGAWRAQWDRGRQRRQQLRQDILDARSDGRRYLLKHLLRPWRYNFQRLCRAIGQLAHPLPPGLGPMPGVATAPPAPHTGLGGVNTDWLLFDPPRQ